MPVHAGAALCCTAAPEADGDRGKESKEIKGLQGGVHVEGGRWWTLISIGGHLHVCESGKET